MPRISRKDAIDACWIEAEDLDTLCDLETNFSVNEMLKSRARHLRQAAAVLNGLMQLPDKEEGLLILRSMHICAQSLRAPRDLGELDEFNRIDAYRLECARELLMIELGIEPTDVLEHGERLRRANLNPVRVPDVPEEEEV